MARAQQSIEIGVPVHVVYHQFTQFEEYPRFLQDVESAQQVDDSHLHWTTSKADRTMAWDVAITEHIPDRCIAWENTSGPINIGKMEVQPAGPEAALVTLTIESEEQQFSDDMLAQDLARLKKLIEERGAPAPSASFAAGSEGWDGTEDPQEPVRSATQHTEQRAEQHAVRHPEQSSAAPKLDRTMQSAASLSQSSDDETEDRRFSVAEEMNLDQQSDQARRVGQMPSDVDAGPATNPTQGMADAAQQDEKTAKGKTKLEESIKRSVPPSE